MTESLQIAVGKRISDERKALGISQQEFADRIGITKSRLAHYEEGRGCLRCGIALDICRNLVISPKWLATGGGKKDLYIQFGGGYFARESNMPFIDVYTSAIKEPYEAREREIGDVPRFLCSRDDHPETIKLACIKTIIAASKSILDDESSLLYWNRLLQSAEAAAEELSVPPRERMLKLNECLSVRKGNEIVPFSYETLFDDLELIGLAWPSIENIAERIYDAFDKDKPIKIDELKKFLDLELQVLDKENNSNYSALYSKIYMRSNR